MTAKKIIATFHPQAWEGNYAIDVQPEGVAQFDVTADIERMNRDDALRLEDNSDGSDMLARSASAPRWIREWSGPYWIEVRRSVVDFYALWR